MSIRVWHWDNAHSSAHPIEMARQILRETKKARIPLGVYYFGGCIHLAHPDNSRDWLYTLAPTTTEAESYALLMEGMAIEARDRVRVRA